MSTAGGSNKDPIQRFRDGEIDESRLAEILDEREDVDDKNGLFTRWASQGLFDEPIGRDEWISRRNGGYRTVREDG